MSPVHANTKKASPVGGFFYLLARYFIRRWLFYVPWRNLFLIVVNQGQGVT